MSFRFNFLISTALTSVGFAWIVTPTVAADMPRKALSPTYTRTDPAVWAPNFKLAGFGGYLDSKDEGQSYGEGLSGVTGSATIPLGHQYGLQVDAIGGKWSSDKFYGTGAHLFWRDPNRAMLGMYGSWLHLDRGVWPALNRSSGIDAATVMAQAEYYLNNVTLRGMAGWEGGDIDSRFTSRVDVSYYMTPDLQLGIGHRYAGGNNALALKAEWLAPQPINFTSTGGGARVSLFAEARIGENSYTGAWGGLRLYFGPSKTLIDKHRRDDPVDDPNVDNLHSIASQVTKLDGKNQAATIRTSTSTSTI
jgi:hypothetical protein